MQKGWGASLPQYMPRQVQGGLCDLIVLANIQQQRVHILWAKAGADCKPHTHTHAHTTLYHCTCRTFTCCHTLSHAQLRGALKGWDDGGSKVLPQRLMQRLRKAAGQAALKHSRQLAAACSHTKSRTCIKQLTREHSECMHC